MRASDIKTYNITGNGITYIPLPSFGKLVLEKIIINTKGASSNVATIYDSNETIGANAEKRIGRIDTTVVPGEWEYERTMFNGIYIVLETGTAADITVCYSETN